MVRVKVCGHTREADVAASVAAGVDAVGVIVDVPVDTPREVDQETAASLFDAVPPFVSGTLVTMPESAEDALSLVDSLAPDVLQIHGGLDGVEIEDVAARVDIPLIIGASASADAGATDDLASQAAIADAILLDSRDESGAGGTGRTHDWDRATQIRASLEVPVVLAGGLTPGNVADAVRTVDPYAVDVATGVEAAGGVKDHEAVQQFVREAKRVEAVEA